MSAAHRLVERGERLLCVAEPRMGGTHREQRNLESPLVLADGGAHNRLASCAPAVRVQGVSS